MRGSASVCARCCRFPGPIRRPNASNELIASGATNFTNNTNNINCSIESNIFNINNTHFIFYPNNTNFQNQIETEETKKLFDYEFESNEEYISFAGEYLNEIYVNLLWDEKKLKFKPNLGYMNIQNDINEQMRAILIDWLIVVHYREQDYNY